MQRLLKWWSRSVNKNVPTSDGHEWLALEAALATGQLPKIIPCLIEWCKRPERTWSKLSQSAARLEYSKEASEKLEVLFENFANNTVVAFDKAQAYIEKHGFDPDMHIVSLNILYRSDQFEDALRYLGCHGETEASLADRADYWQMVAVIRWAMNQMGDLEKAVDRALSLAPEHSAMLQTSLGMYVELGAEDKVQRLRQVIAAREDCQGFAHSLILLSLGDMAEGWRQMESRYDCDEATRFINVGLTKYPRWRGEKLDGDSLLVSGEQGLGDVIQMARYLPMLKEAGAKKVCLEVHPEALSLLQYNNPDITVVERVHGQISEIPFDKWVGMMSLPYCLQMWGENAPGKSGYLHAPPDNVAYWIERVNKINSRNMPKIGLAWSGNPAHRADRRRSIPFAMMMERVRSINAIFFALQTSVPDVMPANVVNVTEEMITLADTAALIQTMDIVITVDTSVVHLAGALGKVTWLLLPKRYEWRWALEGEKNDWYDSVTVIRQTEHANWQSVLTDVFEHRLPKLFDL